MLMRGRHVGSSRSAGWGTPVLPAAVLLAGPEDSQVGTFFLEAVWSQDSPTSREETEAGALPRSPLRGHAEAQGWGATGSRRKKQHLHVPPGAGPEK